MELNSLMRTFHLALSWSTTGAGGSGRVVQTLADYLPKIGVEVHGAVQAPVDVAAQTAGRFSTMGGPGVRGFQRLTAMRSVTSAALKSQRPDILASHFSLMALPSIDMLKKQPFVVHFHGPWADEARVQGSGAAKAAVLRTIERAVYSRGDRVITLSKAFAKVLEESYGIDRSIIRIVPGAADLVRFVPASSRDAVRGELGWPLDRKILITVRRLVPRMGLENLLTAISQIRDKHPEVLVYMIGKGPLQAQLQAQIERAGLQQHVQLLGYVAEDDLVKMYQAADLNVVPTLALEGFGLVAAESLAAGTPALVTPIGGLPEVVGGLDQGLVLRSTASDDIADGLRRLLSGETSLPSSVACREYAQKHFSAELMAERTAAVYRELL
jgi:glycosyltransferase involved in cell wall biosynthesis